jgi:hypothetical protein
VPNALECDWCGRTFASPSRRLQLAGWQIASTLLILLVVGAVGTLVFLNAQRDLGAPRPVVVPTPIVSVSPTLVVTPRVTAGASPTPRPTPTPEPAADAGDPTPAPKRSARVVNTDGKGVIVRADPGPQAQQVGTLREGATVVLVGGEQTIAARLWRQVLDESRDVQGWVQADFLQDVPEE